MWTCVYYVFKPTHFIRGGFNSFSEQNLAQIFWGTLLFIIGAEVKSVEGDRNGQQSEQQNLKNVKALQSPIVKYNNSDWT